MESDHQTRSKLAQNKKSYREIVNGEKKDIWGKRFDVSSIVDKPSVKRFFIDPVSQLIGANDRVLDLGCGPGSFMVTIAPYCNSIVGTDVVDSFIDQAQDTISAMGISNASAVYTPDGKLPFSDGEFDVLMAVDVIHHLENIEEVLLEAFRVLKPGGRFIVFEPNKLNPLLATMHLIDPNEHGLLRLGTPGIYRRLLSGYGTIEGVEFSGLVIGPDSPVFDAIANFVSYGMGRVLFGWLNPKIFITGLKNVN
jgi:2-polyprenyl-3-methyl-5-hydroxy-6-metoxy-1,4-benzoquinol methylase